MQEPSSVLEDADYSTGIQQGRAVFQIESGCRFDAIAVLFVVGLGLGPDAPVRDSFGATPRRSGQKSGSVW